MTSDDDLKVRGVGAAGDGPTIAAEGNRVAKQASSVDAHDFLVDGLL